MEYITLKKVILLWISVLLVSCHPEPRVYVYNRIDDSITIKLNNKTLFIERGGDKNLKTDISYKSVISSKFGKIDVTKYSDKISKYYSGITPPYRPVTIIDRSGMSCSHMEYLGQGKYRLVPEKLKIAEWVK